ncbi:MAG: molybdopterin-dependent oxidoreductase [Candidatus Eremiobacteraeota bacterium]|nr:molybdopterin-dependent oxidoreductase [Candidatus Eremiobacteraeota bacterium]MCW5867733.1 molybdopterin-dependent oxidoreductase [Candidatus Eremiobacteraeota bacterium]
MPTRQTTCSRDCPDTCSLVVEVNEQGRAVKLRGSAQDPVTQGFLCERTSRFLDRQYASDRFTRPMWRPHKGAPLEPVSWDFALDRVAAKMLQCRAESGPSSLLHYRSGGSLGLLKQLSDLLFEKFGPVTIKRGDICSGAGEAAQEADFGVCDSHDHLDLHNSRSVILWGKNVHTSAPHLLPLLVQLKQKGTRLIGIDPVRTRQASLVDHFIQPRPGGDFALAMAAVSRLLEKGLRRDPAEFCDHYPEFLEMLNSRDDWPEMAGVSPAEVEILAEALHQGPASIQLGWGMPRRRHGAALVRAVDALAAISGNLGLPGGGVSYYYRRRSAFDGLEIGGLDVAPRSFSEPCLGREILQADPPVRFAWVTAGNPVSMLPDSQSVRRALSGLEMLVVVETHPTDTTDIADVVLPTRTLLEDEDLLGAYGNHYLRSSQPAVEAPGEVRHELWIWQELARRLQLSDVLEGTPRQWKERMMVRLRETGIGLEDLERGAVRNPYAGQVLFAGLKFPTPSGKMQLIHQAPEAAAPDPEFPLQLAAFSTTKAQCSQWAVSLSELSEARVHPETAGALPDGAEVSLETRRGRMTVRLRHDDRVHPSLVVLPKGRMLRQGGCVNQLIEARETDLGGGANYYEEPVRLVALG